MKNLGGQASPQTLRERSGIAKTTGTLYDNFNGWFEHAGRGIYRISPKGERALKEFQEAVEKLM